MKHCLMLSIFYFFKLDSYVSKLSIQMTQKYYIEDQNLTTFLKNY